LRQIDPGRLFIPDLEDQRLFQHQRAVSGEGLNAFAAVGLGA
jgi:hypothetical protein